MCPIIAIHGLANRSEKQVLEKRWNEAIREGLLKHQFMAVAENTGFSLEMVLGVDINYPNQLTDEKFFGYLRAPEFFRVLARSLQAD